MKERQATKQESENGKTSPTETPTMLDQKVLYCTPRPGNQQPATAFVTLARPIQSNWTRSRTRPGDARDGSLAMKLLCNASLLLQSHLLPPPHITDCMSRPGCVSFRFFCAGCFGSCDCTR